jgi:hypothetical protein
LLVTFIGAWLLHAFVCFKNDAGHEHPSES